MLSVFFFLLHFFYNVYSFLVLSLSCISLNSSDNFKISFKNIGRIFSIGSWTNSQNLEESFLKVGRLIFNFFTVETVGT